MFVTVYKYKDDDDDDDGFSMQVERASHFVTSRVRTSHIDIIPMLGLNKSNIFLDEQ